MTEATEAKAADQPTDQNVQIQVNAQYLKDLSFESPQAPQILTQGGKQPAIEVGVDVRAQQLAEDTYESALALRAEAQLDGKTVFLVEVTYAGVFTLKNLPEEHRRPFLLIEAPRLLFPFLRQIVSQQTREGGFPPLMIDPIDFVQLYQKSQAREAAQPPKASNG